MVLRPKLAVFAILAVGTLGLGSEPVLAKAAWDVVPVERPLEAMAAIPTSDLESPLAAEADEAPQSAPSDEVPTLPEGRNAAPIRSLSPVQASFAPGQWSLPILVFILVAGSVLVLGDRLGRAAPVARASDSQKKTPSRGAGVLRNGAEHQAGEPA